MQRSAFGRALLTPTLGHGWHLFGQEFKEGGGLDQPSTGGRVASNGIGPGECLLGEPGQFGVAPGDRLVPEITFKSIVVATSPDGTFAHDQPDLAEVANGARHGCRADLQGVSDLLCVHHGVVADQQGAEHACWHSREPGISEGERKGLDKLPDLPLIESPFGCQPKLLIKSIHKFMNKV